MNTVTPLLQTWLLDHLLMNRVTCIPALDLLALLPDASVDLIATDPPFNIDKAAWDSWATIEDFLEWLDLHVREMKRVLKPNGSLYLFCATKYASKVEGVIENHFAVLNNIRWKKPPFSTKAEMFDKDSMRAYFPASESIIFAEQYSADSKFADEDYRLWGRVIDKMRFKLRALTENKKDEVIAVYASDGRYTTPASIRVNASRQMGWLPTEFELMTEAAFNRVSSVIAFPFTYADLRREYEDLRREYEDLRRPFFATPNSPYTDVWEFPTVNTYPGKHLAEKPLAMMRHIIRTSSRPDALVLDPFMGSGTTAEAAILEGRRFIGGDFDKHWVRKANIRAENARIGGAQMALFAA